ncbi:MAG: hypothetical protein KC777_14140 [Cyanobacteria bacterium HKST-UBA02]|nr:hypothetical protein [Cyanobacteria bacterium HKST-UBA02]
MSQNSQQASTNPSGALQSVLEAMKIEPELVRRERDNLLVRRAQCEILLLRLLATFDPARGEVDDDPLGSFAAVSAALETQLQELESAIASFDDLGVAANAGEDALSLIGLELDEHVRRVAEIRSCLAQLR